MATFDIKMPKLGESITEGTITAWRVKVGDMIEEDNILFEVTTAKVGAEIPSPVEGKIIKILHNVGETVAVGTTVAVVSLDGAEEVEETSTKAADSVDKEEKPKELSPKVAKSSEDRWYSPVVLEKAKSAGLTQEELDSICGTGFEGRVSKNDVVKYIEQKKGAPAPAPKQKQVAASEPKQQFVPQVPIGKEDTVIPMDPVRRIIADRMVQSKQISPHVTNVIEVDVTKLVNWRNAHKDEFKKKEGVSLTFMAPIVHACAQALKDFPRVNASVDGYNIIERKHVNIGVAVSLNDGNLIVPVIKDADGLNVSGLAKAVANMASKARSNQLEVDEMTGGTFTISNFGSFKSQFGTPIINQPEVAILGVGTIEKKPAVVETPEGDVIAIRHKMQLALSYDHRIIDGMLGGNFLLAIAKHLQDWEQK